MSLLRISNFKLSYGGIEAVRGVSLDVNSGECVCVIGANGAGKTSLLKGVMNLLPHHGDVVFENENISQLPTHDIAARGLVLVPEGRGVFARMTVAENLDLGAYLRQQDAVLKADFDRVYNWFPRLAERRDQLAGTLSGGEQQMLAMGRALLARPRVLLLDEPSMGLAPLMVEKIYSTIGNIIAEGVTLLLIEQNAHLALQVSQRGYVMESGVMSFNGPSSALANDPRVRAAYLGDA